MPEKVYFQVHQFDELSQNVRDKIVARIRDRLACKISDDFAYYFPGILSAELGFPVHMDCKLHFHWPHYEIQWNLGPCSVFEFLHRFKIKTVLRRPLRLHDWIKCSVSKGHEWICLEYWENGVFTRQAVKKIRLAISSVLQNAFEKYSAVIEKDLGDEAIFSIANTETYLDSGETAPEFFQRISR